MSATVDPQVRSNRNPTYRSYKAMLKRCRDKSNNHYGGRGIGFASRWMDYDLFLADMGPRPEGTTLDREDSDVGYCKANCRWADKRTQQNNRRSCRVLEFNGKTMTVTEWAREIGISDQTLFHRLNSGWSVERALSNGPLKPFAGNQWQKSSTKTM